MRLNVALAVMLAAWPAAAVAQDQPIRIHAQTVLDGTGKVLRDQTIVVQRSRITAVETGGGAATYDLGRLTVMPGMIDVHAHLGWHFGPDGRYAARGGTP